MCWKLSLLSDDTDWAVRQPPYKSSCFVTPCLETWAGAAAAGTPLARRRSLGSHSRRNNEFGASQTAILVSILTQIEWQRRAQSYVCWETTCGSVTTRWDNSCLREDVITERAVWQERKAKRVVVAMNVFFVFCMGSVVCLYNCMRMTIWTYYWVSYR